MLGVTCHIFKNRLGRFLPIFEEKQAFLLLKIIAVIGGEFLLKGKYTVGGEGGHHHQGSLPEEIKMMGSQQEGKGEGTKWPKTKQLLLK